MITRPATLSGGPMRYGRTLTVHPGTVTPADLTPQITWLRDGVQIPGATDTSYRLGADDVAHHVRVRVTWARPGYTTVTEERGRAAQVQAWARIRFWRPAVRTVRVHVAAMGRTHPVGTVRLSNRAGHVLERPLVDGVATFQARWIYSGHRRFTAEYLGSWAVRPGKRVQYLDVPRS